jgi:hypothetical protein
MAETTGRHYIHIYFLPHPHFPQQTVIHFSFSSLEAALRRGGIFRRLQRRGPVE